jgi:thioredoxin-dependent peroxiredoxin
MLTVGDSIPDFEGTTGSGSRLSAVSLRGRAVVLYFYPKAGSLGCTRESVEFARHFDEFRARGVEVVGVSVDSPSAQHTFAESCSLPFPLVADEDREIARKFGVLGAFGFARRVTFLIQPDGRIADVVTSPLPGPHVRRAREFSAAKVPSPYVAPTR